MGEINKLQGKTRIGDAVDNIELDPVLGKRYTGSTTVWKDMIGDLFGRRLESTAGRVDYDYENNCIDFASGGSITTANDRVGANIEINHEMMIGSGISFYLHTHWFQAITSNTPDVLDTTAYELTVRWRLLKNSYGVELTTPVWNTTTITSNLTNNVFDTTNTNGEEYINQITQATDIMTVDCGISDTIQLQMARTDSLGGTLKVYFIDIHGAVDSDGSDGIISKN